MADFVAAANENGVQWDVFDRGALVACFFGFDAQDRAEKLATNLNLQRQSQDRGFGGVS